MPRGAMRWPGLRRHWLAMLCLCFLMLAGPAVALAKTKPERHLASSTPHMVVISHEGGRTIQAARTSLAWGADAVEVDLVEWHGQLYVSHNLLPLKRKPDVPTLTSVWPEDEHAHIVEFDLKESTPAFQHDLLSFIAKHRGAKGRGPEMFVSCRDMGTLRVMKRGAPEVFRFLSIGYPRQLKALEQNPSALPYIDGVSIDQTLLTPSVITWLHGHHLLIFAWTIDNPAQAQLLMREGVDGITTDRGIIGEALIRDERGEQPLLQRMSPSGATVA